MSYKGKYKLKNPQKYNGNPCNVIYRSLWERKYMVKCDTDENILEWSSEEIVIPYLSPVDGRWHRYFPDFLVKIKTSKGVRTTMIEVKPKYQTQPPVQPSRKTRKFLSEVMTWGVNQAKWKSAKEYCLDRGWDFQIITEEHLGL